MNKKRKDIIRGNEISDLYTFSLGGYKQKVLIEGKKKEFPIVITLHGGPGTPVPFSVGCQGLFPAFTDRFIMVYWDQLGCGINNYKIDEHFTIGSFVDMTADLIKAVRKLFPNNKIYLCSMSWGSILSVKVLETSSDIVHGVVVYGQILKDVFFNKEVLDVLEQSKIPRKKLALIKSVDKNHVAPKDLVVS